MTYITTINSNGIRLPKEITESFDFNGEEINYEWRLNPEGRPFINLSNENKGKRDYKEVRKHITGYYIKSKFLKAIYPGTYKKVVLETVPGYPSDFFVRPLTQ